MSLNNFNVVLPENSKRFMSGNCDGIHITGLCGKLTMKNCDFSGLGDDALNIHSIAATVTGLDYKNGILKCNYSKKRPDVILPPDWCQKGDTLTVLNSADCTMSGQIKVNYFKKDRISSSAVLAAQDVRLWYEVGPIKNMQISNNTFRKCAFSGNETENSVITVKNSHGKIDDISFGVHENIFVSNNTFYGKKGKLISIMSCDNLNIENNTFANCGKTEPLNAVEAIKCTDTVEQNNEFTEEKND